MLIDLSFWEKRKVYQQEYMEDLALRFYKNEISSSRFNEILYSAQRVMINIDQENLNHKKIK